MVEMLISAVMPIMCIYRLPHGQYDYSGHVINQPAQPRSGKTYYHIIRKENGRKSELLYMGLEPTTLSFVC